MLFRSARGIAASVAAVFVAELAVFVVLSGRFGLVAVSLISAAASLIGLRFLVRYAPGAIVRTLSEFADAAVGRPAPTPSTTDGVGPHTTDRPAGHVFADRALKVAAALLLAFPGLLTGVIGSVLFVGPVRRLLAPTLGSRLSGLVGVEALDGRGFRRRRDVVDVTSSVKDPARPPASSARRAQPQSVVHELP